MVEISLESISEDELERFSDRFSENAGYQMLAPVDQVAIAAPNRLAYKVELVGEVVAIVIVTVDNALVGHVSLIVDPSARRHHVGSEAIRVLLGQPEIVDLAGLEASVQASNTGAQKILIKNGFARIGFDSNGYIKFELARL